MDTGFIFSMVIALVVLAATAPVLWFAYKMVMNLQKGAAEERRLLQTGQPAQGQILSAQPTGTSVNNNPQVQFTVLITPPGGQPYQAQVTKIVSLFEMSQYQVGAACQARIDPMNPQHVAIFPGGMGGAMGVAPQMMAMQGAPQMMAMQGAQPQGAWPGPPQGGAPQGGYGPPQGGAPQGGYGQPQGGAPQGGYGQPQGGPPQGGWGGQGGQGGPQGGWGR